MKKGRMKKAPVTGGQLVTSMNPVKTGGISQGRGVVMSNPSSVTMGVGKGGTKRKATARRPKAY